MTHPAPANPAPAHPTPAQPAPAHPPHGAAPSIAILFNVQHASLAACLGALLPAATIASFDITHTLPDPAALLAATHIITQDIPPNAGRLATATLRAGHPSVHVVPPLRFAGFHPDTVGITLDGVALGGPAGPHHSRIAVCGYLAGLTPADTADLYNRLVFHKLDYLSLHASQSALLAEQYAIYGLPLTEALESLTAQGCFMHSPTHPRITAMMALARQLCARLNLHPAPDAATPPDPLAPLPAPPVEPELLRALNLPADPSHAPPNRDAFITASYAMFARVPRHRLRAAPGVATALRRLNLTETAPQLPPPPAGHALLTRTGQILRLDFHSGLLLQAPLHPAEPDAQDLCLALPPLPLKSPAKSALLGGLDILPAPPAPGAQGLITLRRTGQILTISPGHEVTTFAGVTPTAADALLPLAAAPLAALRALFAGDWRLAGADTPIPREALTPPRDFILTIAGHAFDLRDTTLALDANAGDTAAPDIPGGTAALNITTGTAALNITTGAAALNITAGAAALNITGAGRALTLLADPQPKPRPPVLPPLPAPPEAATPMAFRATAGHRLALRGPSAALHPPVTISAADRDWFIAALAAHDLALGVRPQQATLLRRRHATVLFHPGHQGSILTEAGHANAPGLTAPRPAAPATANRPGAPATAPSPAPPETAPGDLVLAPQAPSLPRLLRQDGPYLRADPALFTANALVEGPVCIPYATSASDPALWLTEALPRLELLQPHLPPGTRLLLPGTLAQAREDGDAFDPLALLGPLGLANLKMLELDAPACRVEDVVWADAPLATLPAACLRALRDRARAGRPPERRDRRLYIRRRTRGDVMNYGPLEHFLKTHRFEFLGIEELDALRRLDLFAEASWIIAPSGPALANLLFCAQGTRIMELAPAPPGPDGYDPRYWLMAESLGLDYAVLPCPTTTGEAAGPLVVEQPRLRALFHTQSLRDQ